MLILRRPFDLVTGLESKLNLSSFATDGGPCWLSLRLTGGNTEAFQLKSPWFKPSGAMEDIWHWWSLVRRHFESDKPRVNDWPDDLRFVRELWSSDWSLSSLLTSIPHFTHKKVWALHILFDTGQFNNVTNQYNWLKFSWLIGVQGNHW